MFNAEASFKYLKEGKPPYKCPAENCGKILKSYAGAKVHMFKSHNCKTKKPKNERRNLSVTKNYVVDDVTAKTQTMQYADIDSIYEVVIDGQPSQININNPLELVDDAELRENEVISTDNCLWYLKKPNSDKINSIPDTYSEGRKAQNSIAINPAEESFRFVKNYESPNSSSLPSSYYINNQGLWDDLSKEVEYDMDDEDVAWLSLVNEKQKKMGLNEYSEDVFELLMDCLEKESYFQCQALAEETLASIDENAVCCICNDGDCDDSNAILFCDLCNLPVHQECYGVPYIPEGQWLCRKCAHSPSCDIDCVLCPNKDGAFKQTDDKRWAHVICALWIPEVGFTNPNFLEPIDSIQNIPRARWKLCCYICKKKNVGACIQCKKNSCYTAFHVTCAQNEGLFMEMKAVKVNGFGDAAYEIRKSAFCCLHTPQAPCIKGDESSDDGNLNNGPNGTNALETLTELSVPVSSIPNISTEVLGRRMRSLNISYSESFLRSFLSFWKLKRQARNGAPLLRRLQVMLYPKQKQDTKDTTLVPDEAVLKRMIKIRQDFEKVRLLLEMVQKREKLKLSLIRLQSLESVMKLQPFIFVLLKTLKQLQEKDVNNVFAEPVDVSVVTDYLELIKKPMDFSTMQRKIQTYQYHSFAEFEEDFNLMLDNCLLYNGKDTPYYRIALEMQSQCCRILQRAKDNIMKNNLDSQTNFVFENTEEHKAVRKNNLKKKPRNHLHIASTINCNKQHKTCKNTYHFVPTEKKSRKISVPMNTEISQRKHYYSNGEIQDNVSSPGSVRSVCNPRWTVHGWLKEEAKILTFVENVELSAQNRKI